MKSAKHAFIARLSVTLRYTLILRERHRRFPLARGNELYRAAGNLQRRE